jgi:IclR family transcriptional regulator, KDG regulon repressor
MSSTARILGIIETIVTRQETGLTFTEIVAQSGMPKATVHRILKELSEAGYLAFSPDTKKFRGSLKLASLGAGVMASFDLRDHVHPQMIKMHQETQHTCNLAVKHGDLGIYVDKIESQDFGIKLFSAVGKTFPLHCTALGKVLLAHSSPQEVTRVLSLPLTSFTAQTITDPEKLREELQIIRKQGYSVDREEITRGLMCVAAPIYGHNEDVLGAISATFPKYLYEERGIASEIEVVKRYAAAISGSSVS